MEYNACTLNFYLRTDSMILFACIRNQSHLDRCILFYLHLPNRNTHPLKTSGQFCFCYVRNNHIVKLLCTVRMEIRHLEPIGFILNADIISWMYIFEDLISSPRFQWSAVPSTASISDLCAYRLSKAALFSSLLDLLNTTSARAASKFATQHR